MKLKKCKGCNIYTLEEKCPKCSDKISDAHYKFIRIKTSAQKEKQQII